MVSRIFLRARLIRSDRARRSTGPDVAGTPFDGNPPNVYPNCPPRTVGQTLKELSGRSISGKQSGQEPTAAGGLGLLADKTHLFQLCQEVGNFAKELRTR